MPSLESTISALFEEQRAHYEESYFSAFDEFKAALNEGRVRAAEPDASSPSGWRVNGWVKKGILLGFRLGRVVSMPPADLQFRDKHTYPLKQLPEGQNIRVVPGGSSIRDGCYIAQERDLHAAHVHQRGRLCGRRDHGGLARAGGLLRAGGQARATSAPRRKLAACWNPLARCPSSLKTRR